ncbi:hypothetical protein KEM52_005476 [Ascosphaera acerosa]|nr:hypothetical protein KEM52_005476 [Ascosphaera acerosa]
MEGLSYAIDEEHLHEEEELPGSETIEKRLRIVEACEARDVQALVQLATSRGGLLDDDLRRVACMIMAATVNLSSIEVRSDADWRSGPILIGCDEQKPTCEEGGTRPADWSNWTSLPPHKDEQQVRLDVDRSFVYYPEGQTELERAHMREELYQLITAVLRRYPSLSYFQGYHDIAQVLLLVLRKPTRATPDCGPAGRVRLAASALERISLFRIRDYMLTSLRPALQHLGLITAVVRAHDEPLWRHICSAQPQQQAHPYFALGATLTLYAHEITRYSEITRVFDLLLAHEPALAAYVYAATITSRRAQLLAIPAGDADMIYFTLSRLPRPLDLEALVREACALYEEYPPGEAALGQAWRRIGRDSVLRTSRDIVTTGRARRCEEGWALHRWQERQLAREEWRRSVARRLSLPRLIQGRPRVPTVHLAVAVAIGLLSYTLMRGDAGEGLPLWRRLYLGAVSQGRMILGGLLKQLDR